MGLDMYLFAKKRKNQEGEEIGYWRKVNAVHKWFVDHCNNGNKDCNCQSILVKKTDLKKLKDTCEKVLKNHELAKELLPTQDGFWFGSLDYDEYYFDDLQQTLGIIEEAQEFLEENPGMKIYYYAWW